MRYYNEYQKMNYKAKYGVGGKKPVKMYDCFYNGQLLVNNCHYAVCNAKRQKLLKEQPKNYQAKLFSITEHK